MHRTLAIAACIAALCTAAPSQAAPHKAVADSGKKSMRIICVDGTRSHADEVRGACTGHGGIDRAATDKAAAQGRGEATTRSRPAARAASARSSRP